MSAWPAKVSSLLEGTVLSLFLPFFIDAFVAIHMVRVCEHSGNWGNFSSGTVNKTHFKAYKLLYFRRCCCCFAMMQVKVLFMNLILILFLEFCSLFFFLFSFGISINVVATLWFQPVIEDFDFFIWCSDMQTLVKFCALLCCWHAGRMESLSISTTAVYVRMHYKLCSAWPFHHHPIHACCSWSRSDNNINICVYVAIPNEFHRRLGFSWFPSVSLS